MASPDLLREAERQLRICNACRYCAGYCAVFPAMELRRSFPEADLRYLANLCFDCRACYYACQYAPPHEFAVNIPRALAELRLDTYIDYAWPHSLSGLFRQNGLAVALITATSVAVVLILVLVFQDPAVMFSTHVGEGAFYAVIPFAAMVLPAMGIGLYSASVLVAAFFSFWRDAGGSPGELIDFRALGRATRDAFGLEHMKGGGAGCTYPTPQSSHARRRLHHLVLYGFLLDLASTTLAACYENFLHQVPPYPVWSWPVVLGTLGGGSILIGCIGLLFLKWRRDRRPEGRGLLGLDVGFLVLLLLTSLTGLLVLALRETSAMGTLLAIHLGAVAGFFLTLPYGKFAHVVYRYVALVRNSIEQAHAEP